MCVCVCVLLFNVVRLMVLSSAAMGITIILCIMAARRWKKAYVSNHIICKKTFSILTTLWVLLV